MKTLNIYKVFIEDHTDAYRIVVPAESKKDAMQYCAGNGDIIAIAEFPDMAIHCDRLAEDLRRMAWGQDEINVIIRTLQRVGVDAETRL